MCVMAAQPTPKVHIVASAMFIFNIHLMLTVPCGQIHFEWFSDRLCKLNRTCA